MDDKVERLDSHSESAILPVVEGSAVAETRTNLSLHLLLCAENLSSEVEEIESQNANSPFGEFFDRILSSSSGCVVMAVASAEAYINEVFSDRLFWFPKKDQSMLDLFWEDIERKSIVNKFQLASQLRICRDIDFGRDPNQAFSTLVQLRNGIVHFTPEWPSSVEAHAKLSKRIASYVEESKWLSSEQLFPRAWASHGSSKWAVETVLDFVAQFSKDTGIEDRFSQFQNFIKP